MSTQKFKRILIANRGEIALRVMKTCRQMGIETVSIYRDDEIKLPHRLMADISVSLGDGSLAETYLDIQKIITIAKEYKVDAIHPGYGFLSENGEFAKELERNNITFIGPSAESMAIMGDKKASKQEMEKIGVPLVPGYHGEEQGEDFLHNEANKIGYPVLIKASAGGGGKGMRIVESSEGFSEAFASAKREAMNAFANDKVLIEKYITSPRHIEIQVMSDTHGQHFHFFERECSIQRRHQKIVEETPSTALDDETRKQMCEQAVKISSSIDYVGAGTVEFIYDQSGDFFFLEMNTRLQVEHPVTEMVTGSDLVELQIKVAQKEKLNLDQKNIYQRGHSIEVRLYAEDPDNEFMPSIGTIDSIGTIFQNNSRLDSGYNDLNEVTINYDPMLAKLICWAPDRSSCIAKTIASLNELSFSGIKTNRNYLKRVLKTEEFKKGLTFTNFVEIHKDKLNKENLTDDILGLSIASKFLSKKVNINPYSDSSSENGSWDNLTGFRTI